MKSSWSIRLCCFFVSVFMLAIVSCESNSNSNEDFQLLVEASNTGCPEAMYRAGSRFFYLDGNPSIFSDMIEKDLSITPLELVRMAAEQGHADAQRLMGHIYEYGKGGVSRFFLESLYWYQLSAENGNFLSQHRLGLIYFYGAERLDTTIKKDYSTAVNWFLLAADQGHVSSQLMLGACYEESKGFDVDLLEAKKWYEQALRSLCDYVDAENMNDGPRKNSYTRKIREIELKIRQIELQIAE